MLTFVLLSVLVTTASGQNSQYDILIKNGRVIDGTGNPWYYADVGVDGDRIAAIGDLSNATGRETIDATNLVVAPGFIDMHTHVDDGFGDPDRSAILNYLIQGVTTVRPGADGSGRYEILGLKSLWEDNGMGVNAVPFAGFAVIRREVLGDDQLRSPTKAELERMKALVRRAMEEGAWGMSAQLEYGGFNIHVTTEELIELSKVVGEFDGFYVAHIRDEAGQLVEAVHETIAISEGAGVPVNVTHLKATGRSNWGLMRDAVAEINKARARGVMITADQYPFLQGAPIDYITALIDVPPDMQPLYELARSIEERDIAVDDQTERRQQYVSALQDALRDPSMRSRLRESTYEKRADNPSSVARWGWQDFRIKVAVDNAAVLEKNIAELVDEQGIDGFDIVADLVLSEPDILFAAASQSPDDMRYAMKQPWVMISSDGGTFPATDISDTPVRAHPRSFASQAIALRKFVREEGVLTLEDAVRKMTSLPAQLLELPDRGLLVRGYIADIAIFDADKVQDQATYDDARRYATGVQYVLVNGEISVAGGMFTGVRAGNVLLKRQAE